MCCVREKKVVFFFLSFLLFKRLWTGQFELCCITIGLTKSHSLSQRIQNSFCKELSFALFNSLGHD